MANYRYRAFDASSHEMTGIIDADCDLSARTALRERGWFPLEVTNLARSRKLTSGPRRSRLRNAELSLLTRQWSILLASGLTLEQSLSALIDQVDNEATRLLLSSVRNELLGGHSLHASLQLFPDDFPLIYRASIAAGEASGELEKVMMQLAAHLEQRNALRQKTFQALLYPAIVATVATMVLIGLMTYVIPSVVSVFAQSRQSLPWLTQVVIGISDFIRQWGWLVATALVAGMVAGRFVLRNPAIRRRWDAQLLRLPFVGRYLRTLDTTRFASTLAILVGSGVPLLAALEAGRQVVARLPLQDAVAQAAGRVREGMSLASALEKSGRFPPLLVHMIASGEATGQLQAILDRAAHLQQADLENSTALMTTLMEPLLLVGMGGIVMTIVLAVMQPIIEINQLLH